MRLEDVFREHQRSVYSYFLRVVGDRHKAEELTQETFYRACTAALRYRGDAPVVNWLFGIARRVLMESSRKGLFDRTREIEDYDEPTIEHDHAERMDLEQAFSRLPITDREVLMLVDYLGFSPPRRPIWSRSNRPPSGCAYSALAGGFVPFYKRRRHE
ncbi:MAG: sigma-70 family RNA polymerase sigma factor [Actinomycetota bacterium]|nr:sigma-70 family RNA polymerase sigma factor [Actinomycetota bacterium]